MTLQFDENPCDNPDNNYRDQYVWRRSVIRILCNIASKTVELLGKVGLVDSSGNDITTANPLPISGTVEVSSLPAITVNPAPGAATAGNQLSEIAELQSIDSKITTCNTGAIAGTVAISNFPAVQPTSSAALTLRMDEGATYTYIGEALPGSAEGDAVWRVKRLTNANNTVLWADGNTNFDNVWTGYSGLSFS